MAKPMLVTLPFVLMLLDYWPLGRISGGVRETHQASEGEMVRFTHPAPAVWWLVVEKIPLLAMSAAVCVATLLAQRTTIEENVSIPFVSRGTNALVSAVTYLRQFFFPGGLTVFYSYPKGDFPWWELAGAALLLTGVSAAALIWRRRCPWLPVGWFWYLGMLAPVIGLVQVGRQAMADRYTYLPQIGLAIVLAWGVKRIVGSWPRCAWTSGLASAVALAVLAGFAWRQASYWRDNGTLWMRALACDPHNATAHKSLGEWLLRAKWADEAVLHLTEGVKLDPEDAAMRVDLGRALTVQGAHELAAEQYHTVIRKYGDAIGVKADQATRPDRTAWSAAHNNLGVMLAQAGRLDEAIEHFRRAMEIKPDYADAGRNLHQANSERQKTGPLLPRTPPLDRGKSP
jgi:protein O-mannosyl-transferase